MNINPKPLHTALKDLSDAIEGICLGNIAHFAIPEAGLALISHWNENQRNNKENNFINEPLERNRWLDLTN